MIKQWTIAVALGALAWGAQAAVDDCAPMGHLPKFEGTAERHNYDESEFWVRHGDTVDTVKASGRFCEASYGPEGMVEQMSTAEIMANYRAQFSQLGAQLLFSDSENAHARLERPNAAPLWIKVYGTPTDVKVTVIEEKEFTPTLVAPKADSLKAALDRDGHVPLYVHFDFSKATLQPDAQPVINEVARMMKADPALKLAIEGHTDGIGQHDANVKLSQQRAAAVVAALAKAGVAGDRLKSAGYGPDKPVDTNETTEGRAKNRRVELVRLKG